MHADTAFVIALIIGLGVTAQWVAWRIGLPSILLLLTCGIIAGPVLGWLNPDQIFGDLIQPCVSIAVALILYEGGLTLKFSELPRVGGVVRNLVTVGAAVTWLIGALAAHFILGLDYALSALIGAVLVVTGPTVVGPLLRHIRPQGDIGPILRWEGIVIDPVGALLTVLIYEAILIADAEPATIFVEGVLLTVLLAGGLGLAAAALLVLLLRRGWIADYLENALSLGLVVTVFTLSNHFQHESGLLTVTVMGFALANQKFVDVRHIVEFKENLRVLLISSLFIVLAARLRVAEFSAQLAPGLLFVLVLVVVARPLSVWLCTLRADLTRAQCAFLALMAPRGIVAAAVSSTFALRLEQRGYEGAELLVPITFITIIATVTLYGLSAPWVARKLGVAESNPQGVLFVGAHPWVLDLAALLQSKGLRVFMVDSNRDNIQAARMAGIPAHGGSILAEHAVEDISLGGLGRVLAVTPNEWINVLALHRFERIFGKGECYQLPASQEPKTKKHRYLHGRWLFDDSLTFAKLSSLVAQGYTAKATRLSEEFDYPALRAQYQDQVWPLFIYDDDSHKLQVLTADAPPQPEPGQTLISLVKSDDQPKSEGG